MDLRQFIDACHDDAIVARVSTRNPLARERFMWKTLLFCCGLVLTALLPAAAAEEKIYRTGLKTESGDFSVSPNGDVLIFTTRKLSHGMRVIDLKTGAIRIVPSEPKRVLEMARWSRDGKQLIGVSSGVVDNHYHPGDSQVVLIDPRNWSQQTITSGSGVKADPFLSLDGKTVYYFKGKVRKIGATAASHYELFALNLADGREAQLTEESFYQAGHGDFYGDGEIIFAGMGTRQFSNLKGVDGIAEFRIFSFGLASHQLGLVPINNMGTLFEFSRPKADRNRTLYFQAGTKAQTGPNAYSVTGRYAYSLLRSTSEGAAPVRLAWLPTWATYDIAKCTGDIYVSGERDGELVFRRLTEVAAPFAN